MKEIKSVSGINNKGGDSSLKRIGNFIKEARLSRNQSIEELASNLKIGALQLEAIEEGNEEKLPEKGKYHISGGEAPIVLPRSTGVGGRNTHFVLAMANELYQNEENRDLHILSLGTDGNDCDTDAAGAYINYNIFNENNIGDHLDNFSSYDYFEKTNTLIKTGPTGSNVMDLRFIWRE